MSIRDLLDQGIRIQGAYKIMRWDDKEDAYEVLKEGENFELELIYSRHNEIKKVLDREIEYIYSEPLSGMVIEVE